MINVKLYDDDEVGWLEDEFLMDGCRFCGCDDRPFVQNDGRTFVDSSSEKWWAEGPFCVHCDECGRDGPIRSTPRMAIAAWKRMPKGIRSKKKA